MTVPSPFPSFSEAQSLSWARQFSRLLKPGDVVGLSGDLGSGKTIICKGISAELGFKGEVTSPTYSVIQEYAGAQPLVHLDFYRLEKPEEFLEIGLEHYLDGNHICLIEWPANLKGLEVAFDFQIEISKNPDDSREIKYLAKA